MTMASARFSAGVVLSAGLHVLAFVQMSHAKASAPPRPPPVVIEIDRAAPPPPPPPPDVTPTPETKDAPAPLKAAKAASVAKPQPAAQAGKVLAAKDDAQPADFTMVQGTGAAYAGGVTAATGTARVAAASVSASPVASPGGAGGKGNSVTARDLSKAARPVGDNWDCSALFPSSAGVDSATVVIVVRVSPKGAAESVSVVRDPGQGFGPAARVRDEATLRGSGRPRRKPDGSDDGPLPRSVHEVG